MDGSQRSAGWRHLEVYNAAEGTTVFVDGTQVYASSEPHGPADKVLLSAGLGVDAFAHAGLAESHAFWDEIIVTAYVPGVAAEVAAEVAVQSVSERGWEWGS